MESGGTIRPPASPLSSADRYLDLVKRSLQRSTAGAEVVDVRATNWKRHLIDPVQRALRSRGYRLVAATAQDRYDGETMVSRARLDNLQECVDRVLVDDIPGDLIETGVWRGGASILMRAVLAARGVTDRTVWVADSFRGFPPRSARRQAVDLDPDFTGGWGDDYLAVDLATVQGNFERYGLLDDQVQFLEGWFADTLPTVPTERFAVLRLDGDLYESTWDALDALHPKLSIGGYVIVDDYGCFEACRLAVDEYRRREGITDPIVAIDDTGVYWRRSS